MRTRAVLTILLLCLLLAIAGCGGGSSSSSGQRKATSKVNLAASGSLPSNGLAFTLTFPSNVTVDLDDKGVPTANAVSLVSTNPSTSLTFAKYSAATAPEPAKLKVAVVTQNTSGFAPGEYLSIVLNIPPGFEAVKSAFNFTNVSVIDLNGATQSVATPDFTIATF